MNSFPEANALLLELKRERGFLLLNLYVEGNDEGRWFAIYNLFFFFPPEQEKVSKFQSGCDMYFFQTNLCSEKPIFWPEKIEIPSKYWPVTMMSISVM